MKIHIAILLTCIVFSTSFISQPSQESPELTEAAELTEKATKLLNEGKADDAVPLAKRALQIREKLLPLTDPRISISLNYLGTAYTRKGDYAAAAQTLDRLLKILEDRFGPEDVNLLPTLNRLTLLYNVNGNDRKTEETYQRVLAIREKVFGRESVEVAQSSYDLGEFYRKHGDSDRSLAHYTRSLLIYGRLSGMDTPDFERVSKGFYCLSEQNEKQQPLEALIEIRRQLDPQRAMILDLTNLKVRAVKIVQPEYPPDARERRLSGTVHLWIELDDKGNVASATDMCQAPPSLSEASIKAALKCRFRGGNVTVAGVQVKLKGIMSYRFRYR